MSDDNAENKFSTMSGASKSASADLTRSVNSNYKDPAGRKSLYVTNGSSDGNASGTLYNVIASGASGTSASMIVASRGDAVIYGATALDGAAVAVANGAKLFNGYAGSNASIDAVQGGIVSGVEVGFSGAAIASVVTTDSDGNNPVGNINKGGTLFDPLVHSGGFVLAGGGAPGFTVKGYNVAGSGGLVSGGTFEDGSEMVVGRGGTALGGSFAGTQYVQSTGIANGNLFSGHNAKQIVNGGLASKSTAVNGAEVLVSGGHGQEITAAYGGKIVVKGGDYKSPLADHVATDNKPAPGIYASGDVIRDVVANGGTEIVGSDGTATASTITSGGTEVVSNGGSALQTNVSGGIADITSGGYMSGGSAADGGLIDVSAGGTGVSVVADSGGYIDVQSAAIAEGIVANNSGRVIVEDGANISGATANYGGLLDLQSGANYAGTVQVNGGTAEISGKIDTLAMSGGYAEVHSGGEVVNSTIPVIGGTHHPDGAMLKGTVQYDSGSIIGDLFGGPGSQPSVVSAGTGGVIILENGALAHQVSVDGGGLGDNQGGTAIIHGGVHDAKAVSGGVISASDGATIGDLSFAGASAYIGSGVIVHGGHSLSHPTWGEDPHISGATLFAEGDGHNRGYLALESGAMVDTVSAHDNGLVDINGTVRYAEANKDGQIDFSSQGEGNIVTATDFGHVHITDGATVAQGSVDRGAHIDVGNGGTLNEAYAGAFGTVTAQSGASLESITIASNGYGTVQSGATVANISVSSGGSIYFMSGASATTITVASGGWLSGTTVGHGDLLKADSGSTIIGAIIDGGRFDSDGGLTRDLPHENHTYIASGGTAVGTIIAGAKEPGSMGGMLEIASGAILINTSMGSNASIKIYGMHYDDQHKEVVLHGGELTVIEGQGSDMYSWGMTISGSYNQGDFELVDDGLGNTVLVYACFLAGAMIRLENGEVPVEEVKAGDTICVLDDNQKKTRAVKAVIRKRAFVRKDLPEELAGWPVQVCKDAFAPGVPSQDLFVTPEHCFYLNGRFVPARMLVNGASIRYDLSQDSYDYYHVQTEPHAIIWANNTLTESHLETGTRQSLSELDDQGVARVINLRELTWENDAAAPLEVSREFVEPLYNDFRNRALALGYSAERVEPAKQSLIEESDLQIMLDDGTVIERSRENKGKMVFALPRKTKNVRLVSRQFRPSSTIGPFVDDRRDLGVLVGNVEFWVGGRKLDVTSHLEQKDLPGWSVIEAGPHRWTTGNALLPLPEYGAVSEGEKVLLVLQIEAGGPYPLDDESVLEDRVALSA